MPDDDDPDVRCYGPGSGRYLVNLLEGLPEALKAQVTDDQLRLPSDSPVLAEHPALVDSWSEEGALVHTLANRGYDVRRLIALLKVAHEADLPVCMD